MHSQSGGVEEDRAGRGPNDAGNPSPVRRRRKSDAGKARLPNERQASDDDAAHLDCPTAEQGRPRPPDVAALPRARRAATLYATLQLTSRAPFQIAPILQAFCNCQLDLPARMFSCYGRRTSKPGTNARATKADSAEHSARSATAQVVWNGRSRVGFDLRHEL